MLALLLLCQLQQPPVDSTTDTVSAVVSGRGAPTVTVPRIEAQVQIDGSLDEAPWRRAARLSGFSQYQPVDGRPAEEDTEVLVWYSPSALHLGIIASDREPGSVRATVADRDKLDRDDTVTIYLDTFDDRRRAFFFTVNPLGIQEDGVQSEGTTNAGRMWGGAADKNPDYQWDSKGRVTDTGYVVEVRIPFKSLRYPGSGPQRWGFNVQRKVQRTGYQDTWTDVRRASSSFLAQAGAIDGLHDLKRGVVTEIQPFVTTASNGALEVGTNRFVREKLDVNPGVNLRLGFTNLAVDATANPDFSQVESDAGQVTVNQRFALFFAEKRPFFLEGIELFATPNQLVYTRQIASPIAGGKVTGKFGRLNVGVLSAREKESAGSAWFNVARVRGDLGATSTVGMTVTDRQAPGDVNRVIAADSRIAFAKLYYVQGQVGQSWTERNGQRVSAPIWLAEADRTGRAWGFNVKLTGVGAGFEARSGYVPRSDYVEFHGSNRFSWYGSRGSLVEQFTTFFGPSRIWRYAEFGESAAIEGEEEVNLMLTLRGGWSVRTMTGRSFYRFVSSEYDGYQVATQSGPAPFVLPEEVSGLVDLGLAVTTPTYRMLNASVEAHRAGVAIFQEASEGRETRMSASLAVRPTGSIRADASLTYSRISRSRDASEFARTVIPRLKVEYQPRRSLFFRIVGEYRSQRQDQLLDPATAAPLLRDGSLAAATRFDGLRLDCLVSYMPTPGTVAFFGYGSSLETPRPMSVVDLRRQNDGFFIKLAYLIRR